MNPVVKFLLGMVCGMLAAILALLLIALIRTLMMPKKVSDYRPNAPMNMPRSSPA